jgi:hypothetical protein
MNDVYCRMQTPLLSPSPVLKAILRSSRGGEQVLRGPSSLNRGAGKAMGPKVIDVDARERKLKAIYTQLDAK